MSFELDHVFLWTALDAPEADLLVDFGLTEGPSNVHPGQGTANRRFFFHNATLELLWVHDAEQAQSARTYPTRLWERWHGRGREASPFGICLRPRQRETTALPFPAWAYKPDYMPAPWVIHVGENAAVLAEPLLFYLVFGRRPDRVDKADSHHLLNHAAGFREVTALRLSNMQYGPLSPALHAVVQTGIIAMLPDSQYVMEIGFDGETHGEVMDFRPALPLALRW